MRQWTMSLIRRERNNVASIDNFRAPSQEYFNNQNILGE